jgi:hypothetical protein
MDVQDFHIDRLSVFRDMVRRARDLCFAPPLSIGNSIRYRLRTPLKGKPSQQNDCAFACILEGIHRGDMIAPNVPLSSEG